jgi:autophagy-related protein 9
VIEKSQSQSCLHYYQGTRHLSYIFCNQHFSNFEHSSAMASNILSRLLPSTSPSIYEAIRNDDDDNESLDLEAARGTAVDEENLGHSLQLDPEQVERMENQIRLEDSPTSTRSKRSSSSQERSRKQRQMSPGDGEADEANDEVPASLLVELDQPGTSSPITRRTQQSQYGNTVPVTGRPSTATRAKWNATQQQQRLYRDPNALPAYAGRPGVPPKRQNNLLINPKERALWRWANVQNLDNFLHDVYQYYLGKGIYSMLLSSALNLLTSAFVISFSVFLTSCIDFGKVSGSKELSEILIPKCTQRMSGPFNLLIWICSFIWIWQIIQTIRTIPRLKHMHDFYHYLLEIPDSDIQTIQWQEIVKRLMALRDLNPSTIVRQPERHRQFLGTQSKQRMDAHDIANRLMRRDNYMIALINKEILDLTLPIPFLANRSFFSKTMEWNLNLCILDFVFDKRGQPGKEFLKDISRKELSESLRLRFYLIGVLNVIIAPFTAIYLVVFYFFQNFSEYQKNPSSIGSRQYTPHAEWKFRDFNELSHLFEKRTLLSYPYASRYINQFPKHKTELLTRFVAFISGAIAAVLAMTTIIDAESFLGFELTPGRSVLFYLTVFTSVYAATRNSGSDEYLTFEPEYALSKVLDCIHYRPNHWKDRLHSDEVRREFAQLYQMKVLLFIQEVLGVIITPFVLWFSLAKCSDRIVDFFREFTIHVDGLGYVCSFAVFNFDTGASNARQNKPGSQEPDLREEYFATKDGKMMASYLNFVENYMDYQGVPHRSITGTSSQQNPRFPGASASIIDDVRLSRMGRNEPRDQRHRGVGRGTQIQPPKTPRFTPQAIGGHGSPITSILLDPSNQPKMRGIGRANGPSRPRNPRNTIGDLIEDDEDGKLEGRGFGAAGIEGEDSRQLEESWKLALDGEPDDAGGSGPSSLVKHDTGGVLKLVYDFSVKQTEGRGPAVG